MACVVASHSRPAGGVVSVSATESAPLSASLAAEPSPGLEKPPSAGASDGMYLQQLPHSVPTRQSSPRDREAEGPELPGDPAASEDNCRAAKGKRAWASESSYPGPTAQGCTRDLPTLVGRGALPENGVLGEGPPCGSEGKGLRGCGSAKPLCPGGSTLPGTVPGAGPSPAPPPGADPGSAGGAMGQFPALYLPGREYTSPASHYHASPGLQGLGPAMGAKPSGPQPSQFSPRAFHPDSPHPGVFPRYRPHQGMRYPYQPPPQPSYHHYQRTPYYACPQGFSDWQRQLHAPESPGGPPPSQPPPPRPLFSDKSTMVSLQGCETLNAALMSPSRMDALAAKAITTDGQGRGPEEEKLDEPLERPESPKEFLDLDNHNAATKQQGALSASEYLYGTPPPALSTGMGFASSAFPPHGGVLPARPPYAPRPAGHFQPRAYAAAAAASQPNGLPPEGPVYRCPEDGLGPFQAVMMEPAGPAGPVRGPFQDVYRPSG